jgi:hypothetical protein
MTQKLTIAARSVAPAGIAGRAETRERLTPAPFSDFEDVLRSFRPRFRAVGFVV